MNYDVRPAAANFAQIVITVYKILEYTRTRIARLNFKMSCIALLFELNRPLNDSALNIPNFADMRLHEIKLSLAVPVNYRPTSWRNISSVTSVQPNFFPALNWNSLTFFGYWFRLWESPGYRNTIQFHPSGRTRNWSHTNA